MIIDHAISIHQPWLDLILSYKKDIEMRTWDHPFRGWIALHAPNTIDKEACREFNITYRPRTGVILGYAFLSDIIKFVCQEHFNQFYWRHLNHPEWFTGEQYGFILQNATRINPIPYAGNRRIFTITPLNVEGYKLSQQNLNTT